MDLEKCRVLLDVVKTHNLSVTATKLGYSTSGISRIIDSIEKEFGFTLLVRTKDGLLPTEKCVEIIPYVTKFVDAGDDCLERAHSDISKPIKIRIGVAHMNLYSWLGQVAIQEKSLHENIDFDIIYGSSSSLAKMVEENKLDFAFITKRDGTFEWIKLWEDEEVVWVSKDHWLSNKDSVSINIFETENCILTMFDEETDYSILFKKNNITPNLLVATKDDYAAFNLVSANSGISINSRISSISDDNKVKVLSLDPKVILEIGIAVSNSVTKTVHDIVDKIVKDETYKNSSY